MYCQISFSADSFAQLIKYRIADLFRPLATPVPWPGTTQSWLDGVIVTDVLFDRVDQDRFLPVNELSASGLVIPNSAGYSYHASAVSMKLALDVFFASVQDVAAAGLAQPPVYTEHVPAGPIRITVRAMVGSDGIPQLQMELDTASLSGLGLPPSVVAALTSAASSMLPFDIGDQLKEIFPPGNSKVLNAGVTRDDAGSIVLRFTFPGEEWKSALAHSWDWEQFHSAGFTANLGAEQWCMDLDGGAVASGLAKKVNPAFKDDKPIHFDASSYDVEFIDSAIPRVVFTKHGRVENACAGNDVRFDAYANVDLTVPSDNLLRGTLSFDIDKNDWDVAKCVGLTLLNPLSVFITAVDNGQLGIGIAELALSFVYPTKPVIVLLSLGLLIMGFDKSLAQGVIADRLKDKPEITKLPNGGFAFDKKLAPQSGLTKDWLVLKQCTGSGGRMLLTGELRVPDAVLPRLTATDLEGMSKYVLIDRCEPGDGQVSHGSLTLSLMPGYGADRARVQPVKVPTIPFKWGVRPTDGGSLMYQVLNDTLGIYQDPASEYQEIYVPGVPGVVEVRLQAFTVRKAAFADFGANPYPLRLRFFTNGGVREYQFVAPPVLMDYTETIAQAAERINKCKHRGSDLLFKKYLELKWRVDPPVERGIIAQQWEVHVRGLEPGRKATVWNQDTGVPLVHAFADRTGRVDVSLVLLSNERADALLMGLDNEPFLRAEQVRQLFVTRVPEAPVAAVEVAMQQTSLIEIDHIEFDELIETLHLADSGSINTLVVRTVHGREFAFSLPSPYTAGLATPTSADDFQVPEDHMTRHGMIAWRGKQRQFTLLSHRPGRTDVLAEYSARSSLDLAAGRDDLFAQVSSDGRRVRLFQKGTPVRCGSHEWEDAPGETEHLRG
jgi:hypothetical protein